MNINIDLDILKVFATPHPSRDWRMILALSALLGIIGGGFAAYTFWGVQSGSLIAAVVDTPVQPVPVSREALERVIDAYSKRIINFEEKNFPAFIVNDPHKALNIR